MKNQRARNLLVTFTMLFPVAFLAWAICAAFFGIQIADPKLEVDLIFVILPQGFLMSCAALLILEFCID